MPPFDYTILDDHLNQLYKSEANFASMIKISCVIAIFIAIIGLYGLINLVLKYKMKEICIRKVLGASLAALTYQNSMTFFKLIAIANIIAWPLSYYVGEKWLREFTYRTNMPLTFFVFSLLMLILITAIPLLIKSSKAALMNPTEVLKGE